MDTSGAVSTKPMNDVRKRTETDSGVARAGSRGGPASTGDDVSSLEDVGGGEEETDKFNGEGNESPFLFPTCSSSSAPGQGLRSGLSGDVVSDKVSESKGGNSLTHRPLRVLTLGARRPGSVSHQDTPTPHEGEEGGTGGAVLHRRDTRPQGGRGRIGLPEIRLDLGVVQRGRDISEPTELQWRRDKFSFFEKHCSKVLDHLYAGSDVVAKNLDTLRDAGITHVLNCVGFVCPEYFPQDLTYKTLWLQDNPGEDITSVLYDVFDYIEDVRRSGGRVFVHCCQGVSRSTSLVIAYVMWIQRKPFEAAFRFVKSARGVANPNLGFACQLLQWQKRILGAPSPAPRLYRIVPHSLSYDPLHLVPKALPHPCKEGLDPRGAFLLQVGPTLHLWRGHASCDALVLAARLAAGQMVQYEKLGGPILAVEEGREGPLFWEALTVPDGGGLDAMDGAVTCFEEWGRGGLGGPTAETQGGFDWTPQPPSETGREGCGGGRKSEDTSKSSECNAERGGGGGSSVEGGEDVDSGPPDRNSESILIAKFRDTLNSDGVDSVPSGSEEGGGALTVRSRRHSLSRHLSLDRFGVMSAGLSPLKSFLKSPRVALLGMAKSGSRGNLAEGEGEGGRRATGVDHVDVPHKKRERSKSPRRWRDREGGGKGVVAQVAAYDEEFAAIEGALAGMPPKFTSPQNLLPARARGWGRVGGGRAAVGLA